MSALRNVAAVFYAYKDAKPPMYASFASIGLNILLNVSLMWVIGYLAFPLSTALAAILNVGILYVLLPRKVGPMELGPLAAYSGKLAVASAAGGGVAWLGNRLIAGQWGISFFATAGSVIACGLLGLTVFFAVSRLLGVTETRDYLRRFLKK
jgi:putative peptidoglycan lipid II flippase